MCFQADPRHGVTQRDVTLHIDCRDTSGLHTRLTGRGREAGYFCLFVCSPFQSSSSSIIVSAKAPFPRCKKASFFLFLTTALHRYLVPKRIM